MIAEFKGKWPQFSGNQSAALCIPRNYGDWGGISTQGTRLKAGGNGGSGGKTSQGGGKADSEGHVPGAPHGGEGYVRLRGF